MFRRLAMTEIIMYVGSTYIINHLSTRKWFNYFSRLENCEDQRSKPYSTHVRLNRFPAKLNRTLTRRTITANILYYVPRQSLLL